MTALPAYQIAASATRYVSFDRVIRNRLHRHTFFEPCVVACGGGEFEHGTRTFTLRPGDLFIADPEIFHEIRSLRTKDLGVYFFAFNVTRINRAPDSRPDRVDPTTLAAFLSEHAVHLPDQAHLIPLFEHAMRLWTYDASGARSGFYDDVSHLLLGQIVSALSHSARLSPQDQGELVLHRRVVAAIERGLHRPLRVAALARECGMSERTLRRRWRESGGAPLPQEIARRRVARATHLLLLPDMSVSAVGEQVGLDDPAQFSRIFHGLKGVTPKDYRRRYLRRMPGMSSGAPPFRTEFPDGETREFAD